VGDTTVADRNGRQLGHAVLSTLETLPAAGTSYQYSGPVISGATLGIWKHTPVSDQRQQELKVWNLRRRTVSLAYREDLPKPAELEQQRALWQQRESEAKAAGDLQQAQDARAMVERMTRSLTRVGHLPEGGQYPYTFDVWRMGDAIWVGLNGEHYNLLQRELRRRFPKHPILIGTLANGSSVSYLVDSPSHGKGLYQEKVAVLAQGCLEKLYKAIAEEIEGLLAVAE
jgi:hypothetical protein